MCGKPTHLVSEVLRVEETSEECFSFTPGKHYLTVVVLVAQSCPTLCDPMDHSLLGSSVHGILQARILEWVAISFSRGFPDTGIEPGSPTLQADSLLSDPPGAPYI